MVNLSIKGLPDGVYNGLKEAARCEGRSLNSYIISVLTASTEERERRKLMRQGRGEFRRFLKSLGKMPDSTPLIRQDREHGH